MVTNTMSTLADKKSSHLYDIPYLDDSANYHEGSTIPKLSLRSKVYRKLLRAMRQMIH